MNNVSQFVEKAESLYSYSQYLRRDFHRYPELGFQEYRTAEIIARELRSLGLEVTTGIAETGVTAIIEGAHPAGWSCCGLIWMLCPSKNKRVLITLPSTLV